MGENALPHSPPDAAIDMVAATERRGAGMDRQLEADIATFMPEDRMD